MSARRIVPSSNLQATGGVYFCPPRSNTTFARHDSVTSTSSNYSRSVIYDLHSLAEDCIFPIRNMKVIVNSSELGETIRKARKRIGVTQKTLALTAGVGLRYLIELERGKPTAQLDGMFRILQSLGLKIHISLPPDHEKDNPA